MSAISALWRYGPRILIGAIALISISSEIATFFKELELSKDLSSDVMAARFAPMLITTVFFIGVQVQRIAACFTSTTVLAQLAFYIWTVECFFKTSILLGSIALMSFNKDFANKMIAKSKDPKTQTAYSGPMFWVMFYGSFGVGVGLRMILNELRRRDREVERQREALLRIAKDMPPFPITTARSLPGFSDVVLPEEEARRRLLRVRTRPRVITALFLALDSVDYTHALFNRERLAGLHWHQYLSFGVYTLATYVGLYALYRKSLRLTRGCLCTFVALELYNLYFTTKGLVKLYRKDSPSSISMVNSLVDVLTADDSAAKDFPFAETLLLQIFNISAELLRLWVMWQIVKDLEERNDRIAKAWIESRVAAAPTATFIDEKGATVYNIYNERRQ